jgi:hypothetical protein
VPTLPALVRLEPGPQSFRLCTADVPPFSQSSGKLAIFRRGEYIMRRLAILLAICSFVMVVCAGSAPAQKTKAKSLQLKDLPAAVQKTVEDNLQGGEIKNIGKETEDGIQQFEIETVLNGKTRDFNVDTKGKLLVMEEATTIDAIPAAAKASVLKKVADGKLGAVETVQMPGKPLSYEASYTDKGGKKHSVAVKADGTEIKE